MHETPPFLVVNPTPAVQRRLVFDRIAQNSVNRTLEVELLPSGKGVNCARAALHLGQSVAVLLFLGGDAGAWLRRTAEQEGIRVIAVEAMTPTRTCVTLIETAANAVTELVENAGSVSDEEVDRFIDSFRVESTRFPLIVLIGTLPAGCRTDLYGELTQIARSKGIKVLIDTQGTPLLSALPAKPWLVKPNLLELAAATGIDCSTKAGLYDAIDRLHMRGAENVLITDGSQPAVLSISGTKVSLPVPSVDARNPIGSGDSVAGGLAAAMCAGLSLPEAARFALACGSANAAASGYGRLDLAFVHKLTPVRRPQ